MQKNTPLETMYMEYANTVKHFLISLCAILIWQKT